MKRRISHLATYLLVCCMASWIVPLVCSLSTTTTTNAKSPSVTDDAIHVHVEQPLVGVNPTEARQAWLSYQWEKGAGLPVWISSRPPSSRTVMPIMMEEVLSEQDDDASDVVLRYQVTDLGLLSSELESNTHSSTVRFSPIDSKRDDADDSSCTTLMSWDVTFQPRHRRWLWEAVTNRMIQEASNNLASYVATPHLYTRTTRLKMTRDDNADAAAAAAAVMDEWLTFVWKNGGGLPFLLSPISLGSSAEGGNVRLSLLPFLQRERLVSIDRDDKCEINYTIENPGLFTHQVHSHSGRVRFVECPDEEGIVEMIWEVQVRPYRGWTKFVQQVTASTVTIMARNFKTHLAEPGATVAVAPPRGAGQAFAQIPKDTWLGGVLAAHLTDRRSTMEQTISMFQPWTWGRSTDDDGEGGEWTRGYLS